jgi:uncharacterized protein YeaO (DUF488 family)
MLGRYKIYRGQRPASDPLPKGIRQDTRKHTRNCLRPPAELVTRFLANPSVDQWHEFAAQYRHALDERYRNDPAPFDELAALAGKADVYIGCSCPTQKNPDVNHCHTVLALHFMKQRYPDLSVKFPSGGARPS